MPATLVIESGEVFGYAYTSIQADLQSRSLILTNCWQPKAGLDADSQITEHPAAMKAA
jgi:hypothetical protein